MHLVAPYGKLGHWKNARAGTQAAETASDSTPRSGRVRAEGGFSVGVAGFPEGHPDARGDRHGDWAFLAAKVAAGADFVLTQLFYDAPDGTWGPSRPA